ncbi:MAG: PAS domain S-box protein, partial [Candidatus Sericytochromatia bacterium]
MLFSIVIMILAVFFIPEKSNRFIYMGTSTFLVSSILFIMMPKIRLKLLNYLLVSFLFILFSISAYTTVGVHSPSYIGGYLICSFISGLLISPRVGWIVSLISIFSGLLLTLLEINGFMTMHNGLESTGIFIASITFFIINILIQYFYANNIKLSFQKFNNELKERKEVERVLRKNEEWLNLVFENINDGIWDFNVLNNDIILSPNYYTMLGYSKEEITPKFSSYRDLVHPNDLAIFDNSFENCLNGLSDKITIEVRMKTKEKNWKCLLLKGKVLEKNLNNQILRIVGSHTDITEIKNYQDALKLSEERYKTVTSNIPNSAVILFDRDLKFLLVDGVEINKSGYSKSDLEGKTPRESLPLDFAIIAEKNMTRVLNGEMFSDEFPFNDIWFSYNYLPLKSEEGKVLYGMILAQNITLRKSFEQELKMLNETLESKVEQRTIELTETNIKLNNTLQELKDAQEQII